jgi:uncharacterized protein (DUF2164 family)
MVVSKTEFNNALMEINESYKVIWEKIAELEAKVEKLEKPSPKTTTKAVEK